MIDDALNAGVRVVYLRENKVVATPQAMAQFQS
jgi:hypothetical protein